MNVDQYMKPIFVEGAGDRLKEVRLAYNRSQHAIAEDLRVSQSFICKLERGLLSEGAFTFADFRKVFRNDAFYILAGKE
jgi:transcriptional regulator with XRE-family HTH domain